MGEEVADAIRELAAAVDRQTAYLRERDEKGRADWLQARTEDRDVAERRRTEDYERAIRLRAEDRVANIGETIAAIAWRQDHERKG